MTNATAKPGDGAKVITQADLDAAVAQATANATAAATAEAAKNGTTAEKARMNAILACEPAKKRPKAALSCALHTDMTVEQANTFLAALDEEGPVAAATAKPGGSTGALFEAAMAGTEHPEVGAGDGAVTAGGTSDEQLSAAILRDHNAATGYSRPAERKAA
jgi:hypothetical protein